MYSFADDRPDLIKYWGPNNTLKPNEVSPKSHKIVQWRCAADCGKLFLLSVKRRQSLKQGCILCKSNHSVIVGINDFASKHPELLDEWSMSNTLRPDQVTYRSNRKVTWLCRMCSFEWQALISHRGRGSGCPRCVSRHNPKIVQNIASILENRNISVRQNYKLDNVKWPSGQRFEVDILIDDVVVEYDSNFSHRYKGPTDTEKSLSLLKNNFKVIRLREKPLYFLNINNINYVNFEIKWSNDTDYLASIVDQILLWRSI